MHRVFNITQTSNDLVVGSRYYMDGKLREDEESL